MTSGIGSHAEGYFTTASGEYSHAEGRNTVAYGASQTVVGQFNTASYSTGSFIIGSGTSATNRSNLLFASGSNLQITGSTNISGSITISTGSVTMPNRPAFRVIGTSSNNIPATTTLSGSAALVDYNQGGYYNSTTGVFTAPTAGLYSVYMNIRCGSINAQQQAILYKNSTTSSLMWEAPGNTGVAHFGVSGILNLAPNDTLRVTVAVGSIQFDANDSWGAAYIG